MEPGSGEGCVCSSSPHLPCDCHSTGGRVQNDGMQLKGQADLNPRARQRSASFISR